MNTPEGPLAITNQSIARIATTNKTMVNRALRLGAATWECIDTLNTNASNWRFASHNGEWDIVTTESYKLTSSYTGWLSCFVSNTYRYLANTARWLPHAEEVELGFNAYAAPLPDDLSASGEEPCDNASVYIMPAAEAENDTVYTAPRQRMYKVVYAEGSPLAVSDVETVISVLRLITARAGVEK